MKPVSKLLFTLTGFIVIISCAEKRVSGWRGSSYNVKLSYKMLPKKIRKELDKEFQWVATGTYTSGEINGNDTFSGLITERRVTITNTYVGKYEVTVGDFMKFYEATGDTLNKPDTLCFRKDFRYAENEPLEKSYFWHARFKNYPVCGITLEQAQRYCQWKADEINKHIKAIDSKNNVRVGFRLPTLFEAEYFMADVWKEYSLYYKPESSDGTIWHKLKNMNTGEVLDKNDFVLKTMGDDGYWYAAPVNAYKPNYKGLYNTQGNVAEMTLGRIPELKEVHTSDYMTDARWSPDLELRLDSLQSLCRYYEETLPPAELLFYTPYLKMKRVQEVLSDSTYYITKGSSFAHGAYYAQPGAFIPVRENESHSWLGFRVVMYFYDAG